MANNEVRNFKTLKPTFKMHFYTEMLSRKSDYLFSLIALAQKPAPK